MIARRAHRSHRRLACALVGLLGMLTTLCSATAQVQLAEASGASGANEAPLTLERAIELTLATDPSLEVAAARLAAAQADLDSAQSARWLNLDLEAGVQSTDNPVMVFSQKLLQEGFRESDFALSALNTPSRHEDFSVRIVARQPLWMGGRLARGLEAARLSAGAHEAQQEAVRQQLVRTATDFFTAVVIAGHRLQVIDQAVETARAHVELARSLFEGGLVVESDLLLAEVRLGELEQAAIQVRSAKATAEARLNLTLGRPAEAPLRLDESATRAPSSETAQEPLAALVEQALANRPDLGASRLFRQAAERNAARTRAESRPTLGIEAGVEAHDSDFFGLDGTNATLLLGLRVPLFDHGGRRAATARALAAEREAAAQLEQMRIQIELSVRQAYFALQAAGQRLSVTEQGQRQARRSLEIVEDRYRNGVTTLVDLLDAQAARSDSDLRHLEAERDLLLARVALRQAIGDL